MIFQHLKLVYNRTKSIKQQKENYIFAEAHTTCQAKKEEISQTSGLCCFSLKFSYGLIETLKDAREIPN